MTTRSDSPAPDVLFVQPSGRVDHLAGVAHELAQRGLTTERQDEEHRPPRVRLGTRVVVVTDLLDPRSVRALRMARRVDARTVLMMDGLVEWRNTFANPRTGEGFLRPAPVDVVCCSGLVDARTLTVLGNLARPTGLPRIDATFQPMGEPGDKAPVLVATANTPAFTDEERERLLAALGELKQAGHWSRTRLIWRLTGTLADDLGVRNHPGTLREALTACSAVVTTPSTLMVEAMRAGRPTAILHANPTPLWQPAPWVWQPVEREPGTPERVDAVDPVVRGLTRWVDSPERLLRQIVHPTREQIERQGECLRLLDASSDVVRAAELVAEVIADQARRRSPTKNLAPLRAIAQVPPPRPRSQGRKRIVSVVPFEHSPIGGVTTWSMRLADTLERRSDLGYDLHTLLVSTRPPMAMEAWPLLGERVSLCVLDPTDDHFVTLSNLRRSIEALSPDVLLPNYTDIAYAVASQMRHAGVPSVAIAHTDCDYYRNLLSSYPEWDAGVAVSAAVREWLAPMSGDRPLETIVYGVPTGESPRRVGERGTLRLAYVGRIEQTQKRVTDLVPLVRTLAAKGVEAELHIVGDGPDLGTLRRELSTTGCVRVVYHGPRTPGYLQAFWPEMDIAVLVSAFEGTSITMLEAMAHGVVPAVTRVASGVGEWVEEGVTGVTAPVGEPETLALRIAELAHDRGQLSRMGARAHARACADLGLVRMGERYAALFDATLARPIETRPSLSGVTLEQREVWTKRHTEDGAGEIAWLRTRLSEAGYRSVAVRTPTRRSDAVVVPVGDSGPDEGTLLQWKSCAVDAAFSSLIRPCALLGTHLAALVDQGYGRIAIYGAGRHTQCRSEAIESGRWPVVGFLDNQPPASGEMLGLPVVTPEAALTRLRPDAVLLSSDVWESRMWESSRELRASGVHVRPMYRTYTDESAPTSTAGHPAVAVPAHRA